MKLIQKNSITNIPDTPLFDQKFVCTYLQTDFIHGEREVFFMKDLLKQRENTQLLESIGEKYAMFSNVYSEKDELEIFQSLFESAIENNKKIHIVGVTLDEEIKILEKYYEQLGFLREDINCFKVDFREVLVSVSVHIENLMWRGSDYKKMGKNIYFLPPIREAGQTKAMFKGINRGSVASIYIKDFDEEKKAFLQECLVEEHILPLTLGKVLSFNLLDMGYTGEGKDFEISYGD